MVLLSRKAIFVAPIVALAIGVWAELAHLTPPLLFAVALPAIIVSTLSAAYLARRLPWPLALVLAGALLGTITFGLAEGTHVAIHVARGETLTFDTYHSQSAKAFALIGIHLAAGALVGAGVGAGWRRCGSREGCSVLSTGAGRRREPLIRHPELVEGEPVAD